jgi:N-acetylglucosaminyldiphosphoundecaprenol N-acetyl-beta-D-mannosaminyltransferase
LLGAGPGVAEAAAEHFRRHYGVQITGVDAPTIGTAEAPEEALALQRLRAASPDFVLVALGSPKQEIWIHRVSSAIYPSVAMGVGASFDFIAGRVRRAPSWMAKSGLEWGVWATCFETRNSW